MKVKGRKRIFHANSNQKRAEVPTLISNKQTLNQKSLQETKKEIHYILIKHSIKQKYITSINIYVTNNRPTKNMKQKLAQEKQFYNNHWRF